jgi:Family of unknown function (DUF6339)
MTTLWPRMPLNEARAAFNELEHGAVAVASPHHAQQIYAQVGGRVDDRTVQRLHDQVADVARRFGFPDQPPTDGVAFDKAVTAVVRDGIDITWAEAASREVWHFVALVAFADLTEWRWRDRRQRNIERWIATDLTRHTWARLWWRATAFAGQSALLDRLSESDLNQLIERRVIGGNPELLIAMASSVMAAPSGAVPHREVIREATKRLRRLLSFIDDVALEPVQLRAMTDGLVRDSLASLTHAS